MRWLRENWLDFLIFLLIALVAAGIVLYLTGINPFARPRESASPMPGPSVTSSPHPSPDQPPKVEPAPQVPSPEAKPAPEPVVTVLPLPQAPVEPGPASKPPAEPKTMAPTEPTSPSRAPSPPASTPSGVYRVAVGAFADPGNAARLRQELVEKGYPARLEPAGNLTRVVVGPYTSEAEARRVAEVLASYGAQVYRGQGAPPPASSTLYLQVGAFQKEENALALASKLREMDLPVVLVKDGVYRVRIGPVAEEEKEELKAKVQALGLEALEVR